MTHLGDAQVRQLMLDRLGKLSADSPARWGKMSAHQMVCHLTDAYRAALGEKRVTMRTGLAQRTVVKWIALYGPLPWLKGLPTLPEMKQGLAVRLPPTLMPIAKCSSKWSTGSLAVRSGRRGIPIRSSDR